MDVNVEAADEQFAGVMGLLREQLTEIAAAQEKRVALRRSAAVADGTVKVTVNAGGQLVEVVIDPEFLDDHELDELGGLVCEAAATAAREAGEQMAEWMAPIAKRHESLPSLSEIVEGAPDIADLLSAPPEGSAGGAAGGRYDDGDGGTEFATVRG